MSETILEPDEAQKKATEYICQKENVPNADVKIESFEPSSWSGIPVYVFWGKISKQTIDSTNWQAGVLEKRPFKIWITANEGKLVGYKLGEWTKKDAAQNSSSNHQPEHIIVETVDPCDRFGIHVKSPIDDMLDRQADRELKKADADLKKARAEDIRNKGHKPLWKL